MHINAKAELCVVCCLLTGIDEEAGARGWHGGDLGGFSSCKGDGHSVMVGNTILQVVCGDVTQERSDVIVNSCNCTLDIKQGTERSIAILQPLLKKIILYAKFILKTYSTSSLDLRVPF